MIKQTIEQDLKSAMLAGDKPLVSTLRGLKSVILYAEVAGLKRGEGLADPEIISLLQKESKKRQEAADLYKQGGNEERMTSELQEKAAIDAYLPAAMGAEQVGKLIGQATEELGLINPQNMGQIIGRVKVLSSGTADGAVIARMVKERLKR